MALAEPPSNPLASVTCRLRLAGHGEPISPKSAASVAGRFRFLQVYSFRCEWVRLTGLAPRHLAISPAHPRSAPACAVQFPAPAARIRAHPRVASRHARPVPGRPAIVPARQKPAKNPCFSGFPQNPSPGLQPPSPIGWERDGVRVALPTLHPQPITDSWLNKTSSPNPKPPTSTGTTPFSPN
jgi:hypothetical protein